MNVRVIKAGWRNNGVLQPVGTEMELSDRLALWLIEQGVVAKPGVPVPGAAAPINGPVKSFRPLRGCCGGRW